MTDNLNNYLEHIVIQQMQPADIPDGMRFKTAAGWNQTEADWKLYLDASPDGCFAAVFEGRIVGTVTTLVYDTTFAWIGMMLVDPEYRRRGIATSLMRYAMDYLSEIETIKLDATPAGKKVYDRLGFREEYPLRRMTLGNLPLIHSTTTNITLITEDDFKEIAKKDIVVFGANRMQVLKALARNNPGTAKKIIRNGAIAGYCMGRPGTNFYQIGPVVADTGQDAICLAQEVMSTLTGHAVVIDVPVQQQGFMEWIVSLGFTEQRLLIRMYYGDSAHPGQPDNVYAICGPELG